jgi:diacylglycerol kinase (ATP)
MEKNLAEKWAIIVNPIAGNGDGRKMLGLIKEKIALYGVNAEVVLTEYQGHASELSAAYAAKGFNYIIAVGGDGTFNEISRPLVNNPNVVTGLIPAGTGNDFIQILGFPNRFTEEHWPILFEKHIHALDVGSCNGSIFLNGMGIGFDAEVAAQNYEDEGRVKKGGRDKYIWHIVKTLLFFKEKKAVIENKGQKEETDCFINTISIGRRFAGSFFLTPKAIADDGLLDICMIRKLSLLQRFQILLMVPKGKHIYDKKVNYYQADHVNIDFPMKVPYHVDGELFYSSSFRVVIKPGGLRVLYNPKGNHFFSTPK